MPMGPAPFGFAYFSAVKFAGYTAAALYFKDSYQRPDLSIWKVGAARTALGIAAGVSYGAAWFLVGKFVNVDNFGPWPFLGFLLPIRISEWLLILWLFFERNRTPTGRLVKRALLGTGWSYVLDAIGIVAAWVIPGGIWVC